MSVRRVALESKFEEPTHPIYIDFPRSDGASATWPTNTTRVVDSEGQVNFYDHLPLSSGQSIRWRMVAASAIANELQMAGRFSSAAWYHLSKTNLRIVTEGPSYILRDFPTGYRFFDHNKGSAADPRHDLYLYGELLGRSFVRFSSDS